jgi:hypothetical protein
MNPALLQAILIQFVIPEIFAFIKRRREAGLPDPTLEDMIAELNMNTSRFIAEGEAWLATHPE